MYPLRCHHQMVGLPKSSPDRTHSKCVCSCFHVALNVAIPCTCFLTKPSRNGCALIVQIHGYSMVVILHLVSSMHLSCDDLTSRFTRDNFGNLHSIGFAYDMGVLFIKSKLFFRWTPRTEDDTLLFVANSFV